MNKLASIVFLLIPYSLCNAAAFSLESTAFQQNSMIPTEYTCQGGDHSPPLKWHDTPADAQSLALVVTDPDAPNGEWTHWILFNIPPTQTQLDSGSTLLLEGSATASNSWGNARYQGPCPSLGAHRYVFILYALDTVLSTPNGSNRNAVLDAMTGHVIAQAQLVGLYQTVPTN
jgi:Raf kinase inhibitor-like YbhB/YbcL family protein